MLGIKYVTGLISDGQMSLPLDARNHIPKILAGSNYQTKSEIAPQKIMYYVSNHNISAQEAKKLYASG